MLTFTHSIGPDVRIRFSDKPSANIRAMLKANGFRWSPTGGEWWRNRVAGAADFLTALRRAVEPGKPDGACWVCKSPEGFFRNEGPATPVRCDACQAAVMQIADTMHESQPDATDLAYEDRCREECGLRHQGPRSPSAAYPPSEFRQYGNREREA